MFNLLNAISHANRPRRLSANRYAKYTNGVSSLTDKLWSQLESVRQLTWVSRESLSVLTGWSTGKEITQMESVD
jgi:hypothetical protein